ncbi:hypothetical protein F2Q69_00028806 [Brassica cretica]|uniref:Transposase MuDR plant domain-containing protein n=1 Tax=Brassica cretica TaxID=69181 RepID=A0A8S9SBJ3_BRACR|nr:hypothetical protein F2Q69_00028806 [Brassica cretica]
MNGGGGDVDTIRRHRLPFTPLHVGRVRLHAARPATCDMRPATDRRSQMERKYIRAKEEKEIVNGSLRLGELGENGNNVAEGMMFRNREAFKQHMAIYAISMKFQYRSRKSEPGLMVLECCGLNCPWRVYAVKLKDADVFEVRKVVSQHSCSIDERGGYQTQATSSVIGELIRNKFGSAGGGPKPREIRQMMRGDHDVNISYRKAWRSRDVAIDKAKEFFDWSETGWDWKTERV